jgi:hypothetical protein
LSDEAIAVVTGDVIFEVKLSEAGRERIKGCGMDEVGCDSVIAVFISVEAHRLEIVGGLQGIYSS